MIGHGRQALTFLSGASISTAVFVGRDHVSLEIPTFAGCGAATAAVQVHGAAQETDTFYPIRDQGVYSAGSGILNWEVPDSTGGYLAVCTPASRHAWVKVALSTAATGGFTIYIHQHSSTR